MNNWVQRYLIHTDQKLFQNSPWINTKIKKSKIIQTEQWNATEKATMNTTTYLTISLQKKEQKSWNDGREQQQQWWFLLLLLLLLCVCAARAKHAKFRDYRFLARICLTKNLNNERWEILTKNMRTWFWQFQIVLVGKLILFSPSP